MRIERARWDVFVHAAANPPLYDAVRHLTPVWLRARTLHTGLSTAETATYDGLLTACSTGRQQDAPQHLDQYRDRLLHCPT
ncbi:hypothetical protein [Streptomyces sp. NPDC020362]|uniref:hypothetical protein n=1 Tax=unclassified Streptomyces TaxID=2593676 RepID=UPI000AB42CDD